MKIQHENGEIIRRYCSELDDNVIMSVSYDSEGRQIRKCLSCGLCSADCSYCGRKGLAAQRDKSKNNTEKGGIC
ncbi:MAG: hypothetical protein J5940_01460 [Clostridia bacterium]|nr:hypothetical protein [Clostridia bacterium]